MTMENNQKHPPHESNRRPSVSFHPMVIVQKCLHLNNYTDEEIADSWYSHDDLYLMNHELRDSVELMDRGLLTVDNEFFCKRGLESRTKDGKRRKSQNRYNARMAVFEIQGLYKEGKCHENMISVIYSQQTRHCANDAYKTGLKDLEAITISSSPAVSIHNLKSKQIKSIRSFRKNMAKIRQVTSRAA